MDWVHDKERGKKLNKSIFSFKAANFLDVLVEKGIMNGTRSSGYGSGIDLKLHTGWELMAW